MNHLLLTIWTARSRYHGPPAKPMDFVIIGLVIGAVVLGFWLFFRRYDAKWRRGVFPMSFRFNRDHLMEAYIAAAGIIVRHDPGRTAGKLAYINSYFLREFRDVYYDFKESYLESLKHPVSEKSLAAWLNKHLGSAEDKKRIVWFVVELALWDGQLNASEHRSIVALITALGLQTDEFDSYITSRQRKEQARATAETVTSSGLEERYFKVLGLEPGSSQEMIRTAYRRLVKMVHPDLHTQESAEVQQRYAAEFRKIKEAYDYLTSN